MSYSIPYIMSTFKLELVNVDEIVQMHNFCEIWSVFVCLFTVHSLPLLMQLYLIGSYFIHAVLSRCQAQV